MPQPLVSVIVPCRDAGRMLRPALASIVGQSHPDIEIIFVDDGSTDESLAVAKEVAAGSPRPIAIMTAPERGTNAARNHGFTLARGDYIQWFDADDALALDKIALQVAALEAQPDLDLVYGDWILRVHRGGEAPAETRAETKATTDQIRRTLSLVWYPPSSFLMRRRAAERLAAEQAWWPGRKVATDVEYFAIAALLGMAFAHVPGAVTYYNAWSPRQIGYSTPYPFRAATLKDIYARLAAFAERPEVDRRLTSEHRALLKQNWDLWAIPPASLLRRDQDGQLALANRQNQNWLPVSEREIKAVQLIQATGNIRFLAHHAAEIVSQAPSPFTDQAEAIFALERLRAGGLFTLMSNPSPTAG